MKKILCLVLSFLMIFPLAVSAEVSGEISYSETAKNVYIAGNLSKADVQSGSVVTITIADSTGAVKYISEIDVDSDSKYETKFKFSGDLSDCVLNIKEGDNDVTKSVEVAYVTQPTTYSLTLRDENESQVIEADEIIKATADITNKYGNNGKFQILAAFYGADNKMIACEQITDGSYTFYDLKKEISGFSDVKVPAGTEKIKAFMWNDTQTIIPLSQEQIKLAGDKTFGGDTEQITVAFMGDSLTHGSQYLKVIEHYYHTRYPNKDIIFVNKGISGNSFSNVINRFEWDITENEITGEIDEATICLGFNDSTPRYYLEGVDYDNIPADASAEVLESKEKVDGRITTYVDNCKTLIEMCREKGISLTLITTFVFDHAIVAEGAEFDYPASVNDYGLRRMTEEVKKIAEEYDLPVIDMWTTTSGLTDRVREEYGLSDSDIVITGTDGVHPGEQGGFYMSYEFIKQQDGNPIVAKVEVDASTGSKSTERADVVVTDYSKNKVEYEYLAHAIPVAYTSYYKQYEDWGVPVTEDINQEIIKVTGLEEGNYTITIGGNVLTKTYTANELDAGVNIAIDDNNPAQIQSKEAHKKAVKKVSNEATYRSIAITEQAIRSHPEIDISQFNENSTTDELKVLGGYTGNYKNYFSNSSTNYGSKLYEVENWAKLRAAEQEAKELAKPVQRTVVIEKVQ